MISHVRIHIKLIRLPAFSFLFHQSLSFLFKLSFALILRFLKFVPISSLFSVYCIFISFSHAFNRFSLHSLSIFLFFPLLVLFTIHFFNKHLAVRMFFSFFFDFDRSHFCSKGVYIVADVFLLLNFAFKLCLYFPFLLIDLFLNVFVMRSMNFPLKFRLISLFFDFQCLVELDHLMEFICSMFVLYFVQFQNL